MSSLLLVATLLLAQDAGRIVGIGGVFFKSADNKRIYDFYEKLGLPNQKNVGIAIKSKDQTSYIGVFKAEAKYFDGRLMINYIVDDLDAYLAKLEKKGVRIHKRENSAEGRFAWIYDPEGTKIELWQPPTRNAKPQ